MNTPKLASDMTKQEFDVSVCDTCEAYGDWPHNPLCARTRLAYPPFGFEVSVL